MKAYPKMFLVLSFTVVPFLNNVIRADSGQAMDHVLLASHRERGPVPVVNVRPVAAVSYDAATARRKNDLVITTVVKSCVEWGMVATWIPSSVIENSEESDLFVDSAATANANRLCGPGDFVVLRATRKTSTDGAAVQCQVVPREAWVARWATFVT